MNENKTNINWLSMIYLTPLINPYKIRAFQLLLSVREIVILRCN